MRVDLSEDTYGIETSKRDVAIAQHLAQTAESVRDLATYVAGEQLRACHQCGKTRPTRPLGLQDETGQPVIAYVCGPCQSTLVEERIEQARAHMAARQAEAEARGLDDDEGADRLAKDVRENPERHDVDGIDDEEEADV